MTAHESRTVIVLLGGPGSGKGTHGQALAEVMGFQHLSSGGHFRDHIRRKTPLGRRAMEPIEKGQLVPDDATLELVRTMFGGSPDATGFVLDGYPRSPAQAEALEGLVPALGCVVKRTLYLAVSADEIVRRLSGRLTCRSCGKTFHESSRPPVSPGVCELCGGALFQREDDQPAIIRQRVALFHRTIGPLLDFYRATGRLVEIPAEGPVPEVSARVIAQAHIGQPT